MRITIVRHGQTKANAEGRIQGHWDAELSDEGRAQAEKLREQLEAEAFQPTHLFTSPLIRCAETADIATRSLKMPVVPWDDLKEHDMGVLSGLTWAEAEAKFLHHDFAVERARQWAGIEGVEPIASRRERAERVARRLLENRSNGDVLFIVSHGGIMPSILSALMGTDRTWGMSIGNTGRFDLTLDLDRWANDGDDRHNVALWRIDRFNDTSHLGPPTLVDHRRATP
jgi:broad specificity phosphatase PhoE